LGVHVISKVRNYAEDRARQYRSKRRTGKVRSSGLYSIGGGKGQERKEERARQRRRRRGTGM